MRDHAVRMRQLPGREGVGRETLVNECHGRLETRIGKVLIIGADLIGEEHALVDDRRGRQRNRIETGFLATELVVDAVGNHLADQEKLALEFGIGRGIAPGTDEDLQVIGFGGSDIRCLGERGIIDRHIAEAEELLSLFGNHVDDDLLEMLDLLGIARQEEMTDSIFAGLRQGHTLLGHFLTEEPIRDLHQNARAVTHQRVGTDSTAMRQVFQDEQAVLDDLVRLLALHIGNEADAAGIMLVARIIKTLGGRNAGGDERHALPGFRRGHVGGTVLI
ncbi:hypothetical protein D3C80_1109020 [compost metagenome]